MSVGLRGREVSVLGTSPAPRSLRARPRVPERRKYLRAIRALPVLPLGAALGLRIGWQPLGHLFDMGFTRDVWMHRIAHESVET
jgi:hypothetical protein